MSIHSISAAHEPLHESAPTWHERLDRAYSIDKLVDVGRDFLASFDPVELHALPEACRPPLKLFEADIGSYAFELVRHECRTAQPNELVRKLACFFSHATSRLAQLAAYHQERRYLQHRQST